MDHFAILKRALKITWRNRALWVFGVLLALTAGGGGGGFRGYTFGGRNNGAGMPAFGQMPFGQSFHWPTWNWPNLNPGALAALIVGIVIAVLFLIVVFTTLRYLAENALIKMVDQTEETGSAGSVGEGFRKGWSRPAWRMFLAGLVIGVPFAVAAIALLLLGASPLLLLTLKTTGTRALGIVLTVGLELIVVILLIAASVIINLLLRFTRRELALGAKGVMEGIGSAYALIRRNVRDVGLVWVLMLGAGIGWGLLMIPVMLVLLLIAGLIGGGPGFALYAATGSVPAALALGVPLFLLIFLVPTLFLSGVYETFVSAAWTLTYREIMAKEALPADAPAGALPPVEPVAPVVG